MLWFSLAALNLISRRQQFSVESPYKPTVLYLLSTVGRHGCFPNHDQVVSVPKPNKSIRLAMWQKRNRRLSLKKWNTGTCRNVKLYHICGFAEVTIFTCVCVAAQKPDISLKSVWGQKSELKGQWILNLRTFTSSLYNQGTSWDLEMIPLCSCDTFAVDRQGLYFGGIYWHCLLDIMSRPNIQQVNCLYFCSQINNSWQ